MPLGLGLDLKIGMAWDRIRLNTTYMLPLNFNRLLNLPWRIFINIIKIFKKFKIFEYHWFQNFGKIVDLRKQVFLNVEKISECSRFINKYVMQSWLNKNYNLWSPGFVKWGKNNSGVLVIGINKLNGLLISDLSKKKHLKKDVKECPEWRGRHPNPRL